MPVLQCFGDVVSVDAPIARFACCMPALQDGWLSLQALLMLCGRKWFAALGMKPSVQTCAATSSSGRLKAVWVASGARLHGPPHDLLPPLKDSCTLPCPERVVNMTGRVWTPLTTDNGGRGPLAHEQAHVSSGPRQHHRATAIAILSCSGHAIRGDRLLREGPVKWTRTRELMTHHRLPSGVQGTLRTLEHG